MAWAESLLLLSHKFKKALRDQFTISEPHLRSSVNEGSASCENWV